MSTITTISSTDQITDSRAVINTNFSNLNTDKMEKSNNLSDLTNVATARTNLGLGTLATQSGTFSGTSSGTNTGDQTISDATISTTDITTNNVSTAKHGFAPKGDGDTSKFLNANGAYSTPASGATPKITLSTIFETAGRFTRNKSAASFVDFNTNGGNLSLDASSTQFASILWNVIGTAGNLYLGSPTFNACIHCNNMVVASATGSSFFGLGDVTVAGTGHTYTDRHIGFKLTKTGGVVSLRATQANGTTETASSALTTVIDDDILDLICVVNGTASVDYYWRKNGGTLSSATNLTTNIPSGTTVSAQFSAANDSTSTTFTFIVKGSSYTR